MYSYDVSNDAYEIAELASEMLYSWSICLLGDGEDPGACGPKPPD